VTFAGLALPIHLLAVVFQHGGGYDASPDTALELVRPEILALLRINRKDAFAIKLLGENIGDYPQSYPRLMWAIQESHHQIAYLSSAIESRLSVWKLLLCACLLLPPKKGGFARSRKVCGLFYLYLLDISPFWCRMAWQHKKSISKGLRRQERARIVKTAGFFTPALAITAALLI
jgi:hypothetical protein